MRTLLAFLCCACPLWAAPPNVLLIVGDDWGWTDFGFMGHKEIRTPHLDQLAKEGAVFPNGYVPTSLCRASLATILTGQYAHQHKICCNDPPTGVDRAEMLPFFKNSPALPKLLQQVNYQSLQTGKFWEGHYSNGGFTHGMTTKGRHGEEGLVIGREKMQPIYTFIEAAKSPWFVWYAPMMPHEPHTPPERLLMKYQKPGRDFRVAKYMAMCEWTDETIGELLLWLDRTKRRENLLILFVVDNGWVQSVGPPKKGDQMLTRSKNTPYDAGVRTPIIVHQPSTIKPQRYDELASTVDIAPTILDAVGSKRPEAMAGKSLLGLATGKGKLEREAVFGEIYVHTALKLDDPATNLTHRWVRQGDWKLIVPLKDGERVELFNLRDDSAEAKNRATEQPDKVKQLTTLLEQSWKTWPKRP